MLTLCPQTNQLTMLLPPAEHLTTATEPEAECASAPTLPTVNCTLLSSE